MLNSQYIVIFSVPSLLSELNKFKLKVTIRNINKIGIQKKSNEEKIPNNLWFAATQIEFYIYLLLHVT